MGKLEQALIAPYLEGKNPEEAVFSPRTAMAERKVEQRAQRKTKRTPSQEARDKATAEKPTTYREFYNKDSYRQAVEYAIQKDMNQMYAIAKAIVGLKKGNSKDPMHCQRCAIRERMDRNTWDTIARKGFPV